MAGGNKLEKDEQRGNRIPGGDGRNEMPVLEKDTGGEGRTRRRFL